MRLPRALTKGWSVVVETDGIVPATPQVVWELLTDWERLGDWMLEASDFVVLSDQRTGVGVRARATVRIAGITTRDEIVVTGWEPPRRLGLEHLGWVKGVGEMHLTPIGEDRTHVFWREELRPPVGFLGAFGMTAFRPLLKRTFRRDLDALVRLAKAR
jgi:uncharacterized protein YndB with AHSA1/START domain